MCEKILENLTNWIQNWNANGNFITIQARFKILNGVEWSTCYIHHFRWSVKVTNGTAWWKKLEKLSDQVWRDSFGWTFPMINLKWKSDIVLYCCSLPQCENLNKFCYSDFTWNKWTYLCSLFPAKISRKIAWFTTLFVACLMICVKVSNNFSFFEKSLAKKEYLSIFVSSEVRTVKAKGFAGPWREVKLLKAAT